MSEFLSSTNVHVFPAPNRASSRSDAYLLSEKNLGSIFRTLYTRNNCSFVHSVTADSAEETYSAIFVLYGFYFEVTNIPSAYSHASIYVYEKDGDIHLSTAEGISTNIDDTSSTAGSEMKALFFSDAVPESTPLSDGVKIYTIQLRDANGKIPEASKMKWNADTLNQSISVSFADKTLTINTNPDNYK